MTTQCNDEKGSKVPSNYGMEQMDTEVQRGEIKHAQPRDVDPALQFLATEEIEYTPAEARTVLSKIDRVLMPLLCWVYLIQFADKTSLNYASLMGIREDTHLDPQSQQYSWVSSIFYAGYIFWEYVSLHALSILSSPMLMSGVDFPPRICSGDFP